MDDLQRQRERQIVEQGRKQGKSDEFIKQAVLRDRERGLPSTPMGNQPQRETLPDKLPQPLEFLMGSAYRTARDIGTGLGMKLEPETGQSMEDALTMAQRAEQKANEVSDPLQKARLLKVAGQGRSTVSGEAEKMGQQFTSDIEDPYWLRSIQTGADIAGSAALIDGAIKQTYKLGQKLATSNPDIGGKFVKIVDKIRSLSPSGSLAEKQYEAARLVKEQPLVKNFMEKGAKLAEQDPDIAREFIKQQPYLEKIGNFEQLLDRMQIWGGQAFTKGGGVKSMAKAQLFKTLYGEGIEQLKTIAPEVYKNRQLLRLTFEAPKNLGRLLWRLTLGKVLVS